VKSFQGKYNSLEDYGTLIKNPNFLLRRKGSNMEYGTFKAPSDIQFSYLIYRTSDVDFGEIQKFLIDVKPEIEVLTQEKRHFLKFQDEDWEVIQVEDV